ncbi:MAG: restriction endonuclease subunit S [Oscillospiraceae bacterium]|nr:restriction endonuclease subunit S [Oscillospiraceae bacterium]
MKLKLGEICSFQSGGTPSKTNADYFSGDIPWITTVALNGQTIGKTAAVDWITEKAIEESAAKIVPAKSIMVGTRVGVGKVAINEIPMSTSQDIISLIGINESLWSKEFLCKFIQSKESYLKSQARGATIKGIKIDVLASLVIPDISFDSQQEIVAVLDKAQSILAARRSQLSALDDLIKARFVEMFGDETNPYQWPVVNVEDVANVSVGVVIKPAQFYTDAEHGVKAFRSLNIGAGTIKDSDWVYFSHEGNDKNSKSQLRENDLLIVRSGAPGTACVVPKEFEGCNAIDIIIARPKTDKVNPHYLCTYTNLPHGKRQIDEGTGGAAQQHFNVGKYNKLQLMLPTLKQQNEFVSFLKQIDKSKSVIQKSLDETQLLFDRLMQQYYG